MLDALGLLLRQRSVTLAVAAAAVPPLLGQFRVGYNLRSLDVLLHLVVHPRLDPSSKPNRMRTATATATLKHSCYCTGSLRVASSNMQPLAEVGCRNLWLIIY